jgi:hypothetical protein
VEPILEQLESLGWVIRDPTNLRSSSSAWMVNPLVHQRFQTEAAAASAKAQTHYQLLASVYGLSQGASSGSKP